MVAKFCGLCRAPTQGVKGQTICNECGAYLDLSKAAVPDLTKTEAMPQQILPLSNSYEEGSIDQPLEINDSPVSSQTTTTTTAAVRVPRRFEILTGDGEVARQHSIDRIRTAAATSTVSHAGGTLGAVNITKKPILGKEFASGPGKQGLGGTGKGAVTDSVSCTIQLHCGYFAPEDEQKSERVRDWRSEDRRVAVSLPIIPFDNLVEYLYNFVIDALPETFEPIKNRLLCSSWYPALEVHRKDGPVQLARDGKHIRHAKDFIKLLHSGTGPKGSKRLHICWEEKDPSLSNYSKEISSDSENESTPVLKKLKRSRKNEVESEPVSRNKGKERAIKKEPEIKVEKKMKMEKNDGSTFPARSLPARPTVSEAFSHSADKGVADAEAGRRTVGRIITRRVKQETDDQ